MELARLLLTDFDPEVSGSYAQPCRLVPRSTGGSARTCPTSCSPWPAAWSAVNVKAPERLTNPKVAEALVWPREVFERRGWQYEIWSGCDLVVLDNVRFLAAYRRPGIVAQARLQRTWAVVGDAEQLAVAERRLAAGQPPHTARPALLTLL